MYTLVNSSPTAIYTYNLDLLEKENEAFINLTFIVYTAINNNQMIRICYLIQLKSQFVLNTQSQERRPQIALSV